MKTERSPTRGPRRPSPAPAQAGPNLLVHELKGLACRLDLLQQNLGHRFDDPLFKQTMLDVLVGAVGRLQRLAQDLRNHDNRVVVKLRVDLNQVLEEAISDTQPELVGDVELLADYVEVPQMWGDGFLLRCAFSCAIDNALEAMQGQGLLAVSTRLVTRRGRRRVTVEIADTGPGMSREFLREQLFRPFSTTKDSGMGLGAYTFRQVAALHGGSVRILSEEGAGTRVRFHFPCD